jgi:hypothetical protein
MFWRNISLPFSGSNKPNKIPAWHYIPEDSILQAPHVAQNILKRTPYFKILVQFEKKMLVLKDSCNI